MSSAPAVLSVPAGGGLACVRPTVSSTYVEGHCTSFIIHNLNTENFNLSTNCCVIIYYVGILLKDNLDNGEFIP